MTTSLLKHLYNDKSLWSNVFGRPQKLTRCMLPTLLQLENITFLTTRQCLQEVAVIMRQETVDSRDALQQVYAEREEKVKRLKEILQELEPLIQAMTDPNPDDEVPAIITLLNKQEMTMDQAHARVRQLKAEKDLIKILPSMNDEWVSEMVNVVNEREAQNDRENLHLGYLSVQMDRPYFERVLLAWAYSIHMHRRINGRTSSFSLK